MHGASTSVLQFSLDTNCAHATFFPILSIWLLVTDPTLRVQFPRLSILPDLFLWLGSLLQYFIELKDIIYYRLQEYYGKVLIQEQMEWMGRVKFRQRGEGLLLPLCILQFYYFYRSQHFGLLQRFH